MKVDDVLATAKDSLTANRVYAEPFEKNGITIIAAAAVGGGAGGGNGRDNDGQVGEGGGFGVGAKPVGAYIIKGDQVRWQPAIDVNRLIATIGAVAIAALFVGGRMARYRAQGRAAH